MIAPLPPPTWAMAILSTMIGELAAKNCGTVFGNGSFRHTTLPSAAFRHETTPPTPTVTTLPSATAGDPRGPGCRDAAPVTAWAGFLSVQRTLPSAAERHWVTSSSPCREKTYSLSPTRAGVESPAPTWAFQVAVSSFGHSAGAVKVALASRFGPRHCGQSWARTDGRADQNHAAHDCADPPACLAHGSSRCLVPEKGWPLDMSARPRPPRGALSSLTWNRPPHC